MGHEVMFDNGQGRIGFTESHCDYSRYVKEKRDATRREDGQEHQHQGSDLKIEDDKVARNDVPNEAESDLTASGWASR